MTTSSIFHGGGGGVCVVMEMLEIVIAIAVYTGQLGNIGLARQLPWQGMVSQKQEGL